MKDILKLATIEDEDGWQILIKKVLEKDQLFKIILSSKSGDDFFELVSYNLVAGLILHYKGIVTFENLKKNAPPPSCLK